MTQCILNGVKADSISVMDRGLQYGDGLFETIACDSGKLLLWPQHLQRLQMGAERLGMPLISEQQWLDDIQQLSIQSPQAVIKLIQTRGAGGRGYQASGLTPNRIVACYPWPSYAETHVRQGVRVRFCQTPVSVNCALAGLKHLNRLDNVLARNEWDDATIAEGLMQDDRGMIIEGTMSNVFGVKEGDLYTPELTRAGVTGVVRDVILKLAQQQGIKEQVMDISRQQLLEMDELFITNSVIGLWPVIQLDKHRWVQGPVTQFFKEQLSREMSSNASQI